MVFCLSSTGLATTTPALLGDATHNVVYPQQHDGALYRGLDSLHLHSGCGFQKKVANIAADDTQACTKVSDSRAAAISYWVALAYTKQTHAIRAGGKPRH